MCLTSLYITNCLTKEKKSENKLPFNPFRGRFMLRSSEDQLITVLADKWLWGSRQARLSYWTSGKEEWKKLDFRQSIRLTLSLLLWNPTWKGTLEHYSFKGSSDCSLEYITENFIAGSKKPQTVFLRISKGTYRNKDCSQRLQPISPWQVLHLWRRIVMLMHRAFSTFWMCFLCWYKRCLPHTLYHRWPHVSVA